MTFESDEELSLLAQPDCGDGSWRLNFDGVELCREQKEKKPPRGLHDCLGVLGIFTILRRGWSFVDDLSLLVFNGDILFRVFGLLGILLVLVLFL